MAEQTKKTKTEQDSKKIEGYNPRMYLQMKIVYILLSIINIIVVLVSFYQLGWAMYSAQQSYGAIARVEEDLLKSNACVLTMITDIDATPTQSEQMAALFKDIGMTTGEFKQIRQKDPEVDKQFTDALGTIDEYKAAVAQAREQYELAANDPDKLEEFSANIFPMYKAQIEPKMNEATDKMSQTVERQKETAVNTFYTKAQSVVFVLALMILILVIGVIAIVMMERAAKRAAIELQKRAEEIEETKKKLSRSRDKTMAMAYTNVLTDMKNRYALEEDIAPRLESENLFLVNFDYDNFRNFNEVYGRDFGDAFLSMVAERLKEEFSDYAEIYNITSDEFAFVFKPEISGAQADAYAQKIKEVLSANYTVSNVTVQLTVSGCTYRYNAGECLTLNSLLSKMDGVMHTAKNNGGNTILEVNRI